jgi:hypothetical protein
MSDEKPDRDQPLKKRPFGLCAGEFTVPDDFDEALPESILSDFDGGTDESK